MSPSIQNGPGGQSPVAFHVRVPMPNESKEHATELCLRQDRLALLTIAAWSILIAQWFCKEEVEFTIEKEKAFENVPVHLSMRSDLKMENLIQQLQQQLSPAKRSSLCKSYICEEHTLNINLSPRFSIQHDMETSNGGKLCRVALHCQQRDSDMDIQLESVDSELSSEVKRLGRCFQIIFEQITELEGKSMSLDDFHMMSQVDLDEVWQRNCVVPKAIKGSLNRTIKRQGIQSPNKTAVCAWDGEMTYEELDENSNQLALGLIKRGVMKGQVVPVCFEKSMWMPVALLGVIKAGGVILQISVTTPIRRVECMLQTSKSIFALVGPTAPSWLKDTIPTHTLDEIRIGDISGHFKPVENFWDQDVALLFTSGSTGQPKGIIWTHSVLVTNCQVYAKAVSFDSETRVFQSTSYDFDVSILETFAIFMCGGCLCIPKEQDGFGLSPLAMHELRANMVSLTPTEADSLDPDKFPTLKQVVSDGEILHRGTASKWARKVIMYNFYGPAESPLVAITRVDPGSFQTGYAGKTSGCLSWVVCPFNHNKLLPNGAIGELVVEGPIIFDRYIGIDRPQSSFISPDWLPRGSSSVPGRKSRLYKTGDLVRCDSDGNLVILGRKDTQVQLHGERLELSEIEHNVRQFLKSNMALAAEVVIPISHGSPMLALFLEIGTKSSRPDGGNQVYLEALLTGLEKYLSDCVPRAYIPSTYIAVERIPRTTTGKTNRRQLREIGASIDCCRLACQFPYSIEVSDKAELAYVLSSYHIVKKSLCEEKVA